jgi:hypothetical protein
MEFVGRASVHNSLVSALSHGYSGETHGLKIFVAPNGTPLLWSIEFKPHLDSRFQRIIGRYWLNN